MHSAVVGLLCAAGTTGHEEERQWKKPTLHLVDVRLFGYHCLWGCADGERKRQRDRKGERKQEVALGVDGLRVKEGGMEDGRERGRSSQAVLNLQPGSVFAAATCSSKQHRLELYSET